MLDRTLTTPNIYQLSQFSFQIRRGFGVLAELGFMVGISLFSMLLILNHCCCGHVSAF